MKHFLVVFILAGILPISAHGNEADDRAAIRQTALDYIESQQVPAPKRMDSALHTDLKKRTYWKRADGTEFVLETSRDTMLKVAETYNLDGNAFPPNPKKDVKILDIDGRVASVKLTADDWIDYMHMMKLEDGTWKIINVLWKFNDQSKHISKK